ncbi:MAG: hypothetical protein Q7S64_02845 [bacterium]|nr:hypothetical protein [bacterium]
MTKQTIKNTTHEDIITTMRDIVDIFSISLEKLREELKEEIRAARYESKTTVDELRDEFRSFKYEMKDFRTETNATLKQHDFYFENIQQDIVLLGGLETRVARLEKARS